MTIIYQASRHLAKAGVNEATTENASLSRANSGRRFFGNPIRNFARPAEAVDYMHRAAWRFGKDGAFLPRTVGLSPAGTGDRAAHRDGA